MNRTLTAAEHDAYRDPFPAPRDRLPVLRGRVPRLLLHGEPGSVVGAAEVDWCRRDGAGLEIVSVGAGTHFLPEDQPEAISRALVAWLASSA